MAPICSLTFNKAHTRTSLKVRREDERRAGMSKGRVQLSDSLCMNVNLCALLLHPVIVTHSSA